MPEMKTAINIAAEKAAAQATEDMEFVMKEAIRMLREELHSEIKKVAGAGKVATAATADKAAEEVGKDGRPTAQDSALEKIPVLMMQVQAVAAESKKVSGSVEALTSRCEQQFARIQSSPVTRDDLEKLKDATSKEHNRLRGELMKEAAKEAQPIKAASDPLQASKEYIDKQISDLRAQLSQMKTEPATHALTTSDQILELKAQMQEMRTRLSERNLPADLLTRSDLESMRDATLTANKEHVEKKFSELQEQLSKIRSEQGVQASGLPGQEQIDKQISELQAQVSQIKGEKVNVQLSEIRGQIKKLMTQFTDLQAQASQIKGEKVNAELSEMGEQIKKLTTQMSEQSAKSGTPDIDKQVSDLHAQVTQIKAERTSDQFAEIRGQMKKIFTQLSEQNAQSDRNGQSDSITKVDLEAVKEATAKELRAQGEATKELVDKKMADMLAHLGRIKAEQLEHDSVLSELKTSLSQMRAPEPEQSTKI